jgi:hypothetical protein
MLTPDEEKLLAEAHKQLEGGRKYVTSRKEQQTHFQDLRIKMKQLLGTDQDVAEALKEHLGLNNLE